MRKTDFEEITINPSILNIITPTGIEFKRNKIIVGETEGKAYGIIKYPGEVDVGWLSKITNINGSIFSMSFTPTDNTSLIESISRNVSQNRGTAESTKDPLTRQRALKNAEDGEATMQRIDQDGEVVGFCSNIIMPLAKEETAFSNICRRFESLMAAIKCKVRGMANMQKEAYQSLSPYHIPNEKTEKMLNTIMPLSTIVGGFPFSSSSYSDGKGFYFGKDSCGGMIALDPWTRGGDRTNSNWTIMGVAGQGKSATAKHIISAEFSKGTKIIIIDPEREYRDLTHLLGGDWLDVGSGRMGKINPLHIRPAPCDDDDDKEKLYEKNSSGDLALHLRTLEVFFNLYLPDINSIGRSLLESTIRELYLKHNISWDTKVVGLENTDFPTMGELYMLLEEKANEVGILENTAKEYNILTSLMKDIAVGSSQFLWNGHTTIAPKSKVICLDTHDLQGASEKIKKTQYFNILTWAWEQMSKDREEKVLLVCDEAYMMIDVNVPQSLIFLRNVAKRARKYEAGIMIVSHSVVDFLDPSIKQYGQALLDIPCYKVLMGTDGQNLIELSKLYNLTEAEKELLLSKKRKWGLFMFGSKRLVVEFDLAHKLEYITGGGR